MEQITIKEILIILQEVARLFETSIKTQQDVYGQIINMITEIEKKKGEVK